MIISRPFEKKAKEIPLQPTTLRGRKTLVLDLDETLVHSSFDPIDCDFIISITLGDRTERVYVKKRPGLEEFLEEMLNIFEIIIYTSSMEEYANPVIDMFDPMKRIEIRLFRENCIVHNRKIVKTLEALKRKMKDVIIIDNSESAFMLDKENAILIKSFFTDNNDRELERLTPFLKYLTKIHDIRPISQKLNSFMEKPRSFTFESDEQSLGLSTFKEKDQLLFKNDGSPLKNSNIIEMTDSQINSMNLSQKKLIPTRSPKKNARTPKKMASMIINLNLSGSFDEGFGRLAPSCQDFNLNITRFEDAQFYSAKLKEPKPKHDFKL